MSEALAVLKRIRETQPRSAEAVGDRCELCSEPIAEEHGHLVDLESRSLTCACRGCYLLFTAEGSGGTRFRAVPRRFMSVPGLMLSSDRWDSLQIPVSVAFFFFNSALGHLAAFYPGPAGATESELPLDTWEQVADGHPELSTLQPDVEALLVRNRSAQAGTEAFIVPIDICYELVGRLRRVWKGFDGGSDARNELDAFFASVLERAK